jgi:hypothetical protein
MAPDIAKTVLNALGQEIGDAHATIRA